MTVLPTLSVCSPDSHRNQKVVEFELCTKWNFTLTVWKVTMWWEPLVSRCKRGGVNSSTGMLSGTHGWCGRWAGPTTKSLSSGCGASTGESNLKMRWWKEAPGIPGQITCCESFFPERLSLLFKEMLGVDDSDICQFPWLLVSHKGQYMCPSFALVLQECSILQWMNSMLDLE
jgi:hypothetical protein